MTTITISTLPLVGTISDNSYIPLETNGVTQRVAGADLKNYLAALPTISATSGSVQGQFDAGSLIVDTTASIIGALTAGSITAPNGSITNLTTTALNVTGPQAQFTGNISAVNVTAAQGVYANTLTGTLQTSNQPNITKIGTLGNLTVTSPIAGSVTGSAATVTNSSQPAITSIGSLGSLTVSGLATIGSINTALVSATSANITSVNATNVTGVMQTASQPNITAVGTLNGLQVSGAIAPTANASVSLGTPTSWFSTIYGVASQAKYADLAEMYESDATYEPGTVLVFGTVTEVTISSEQCSNRVAGVVSTDPAYLMNATTKGVPVALQGRVPCKVVGLVTRGDMLVSSSIPGVAMSDISPAIGTVIGKALENYNSEEVGVIEVVVGRM